MKEKNNNKITTAAAKSEINRSFTWSILEIEQKKKLNENLIKTKQQQ